MGLLSTGGIGTGDARVRRFRPVLFSGRTRRKSAHRLALLLALACAGLAAAPVAATDLPVTVDADAVFTDTLTTIGSNHTVAFSDGATLTIDGANGYGIQVTGASPDAVTPALVLTGDGHLVVTDRNSSGVYSYFSGANQSSILDFSGLTSATFTGNTTTADRTGGAITAYSGGTGGLSRVKLGDNVTFSDNVASGLLGFAGGAIFSYSFQSDSSVEVGAGAVFSRNSNSAAGGAISSQGIRGSSSVTIGTNANFSDNSGDTGGAIYSAGENASSVKIGDNTVFSANKATVQSGGAIYSEGTNSSSRVEVGGNAVFTGNSAGRSGGAIYSRTNSGNSTVIIGADAAFTDNSAVERGGAVYSNSNAGDSTVEVGANALFSGNSVGSQYGGAIYSYGGNDSRVTIADNAIFSGNSAVEYGGAIFSYGSTNSSTITIGANAVFSGNTAVAGDGGGAIYSYGAGSNTVSIGGGSLFKDNAAVGHGGAIVIHGGSSSNASLTLGVAGEGGDIVFAGNRAGVTITAGKPADNTGYANSVYMLKPTDIKVAGNGNLYFDDPLESYEYSTVANTLTKNGTGFAQFLGDSHLNKAAGVAGTVTVAEGTFRLAEAAGAPAYFRVGAAGSGSTFTLASGANLAGAGTVTADTFTINGVLAPDGYLYQSPDDPATQSGILTKTGSEAGELILDGSVTLNTSTLEIDMDSATSADKVTVTGAVAYGANDQTLNLTSFVGGASDLVIMSAAGGGIDHTEYSTITVSGMDVSGNTRMGGITLTSNTNNLYLSTTTGDDNRKIHWVGNVGDDWDAASVNWSETDNAAAGDLQFLPNDYVIFNATGASQTGVDLGGANAQVSGMAVGGGQAYTFTDGSITGRKDSALNLTLDAASENGILLVGGGSTVTFQDVDIDFDGGMIIGESNVSTGEVHITQGGTVAEAMNITVNENSSLHFNQIVDQTLSGVVGGAGSLTKDGTETLNITGDFSLSGDIEVVDGVLRIARTADYNFNNVLTGSGTLALDLGANANALTLGSGVGAGFTGTVELERGSLALDAAAASALTGAVLQLDADASAVVTENRSIGDLTFNGGTLEIQAFTGTGTIAPTPLLTVTDLTITGNGGTVEIDLASLNDIATGAGDYNTFYDYDPAALYQKRLVAADAVAGGGVDLALLDSDGNSLESPSSQAEVRKIMDGSSHNGNATFDYTASVDSSGADKGIYLGYGLTQIEALSGKTVVLDSTGSDTTGGKTPTIAAVLTGAGGFTFLGSENAEVGNAGSNYTGATIVDTMTVAMIADNAFGQTSSLQLLNGGSVDMGVNSQTVKELKGETGTEIILGDLTVDQSSPSDFAGVLSGTGDLTKQGTGNLELSGDNTYDGDTVVSAGTLTVSGALGYIGPGNNDYTGDIVNNAAIVFNQSDDQTLSGALSGAGALTKQAANTLTLADGNSGYTGEITVSDGVLALAAGGSVENAGLVLGATGTFDISATAGTTLARLEAAKGSTLDATGTVLDMSGAGKSVIFDLNNVDAGETVLGVTGNLKIDSATDVSLRNIDSTIKKGDSVILAANMTNDSTVTAAEQTSGRRTYLLALDASFNLTTTITNSLSFIETTNNFLGPLAPGNINIRNGGAYLDWLLGQPYAGTPGMTAIDDYFADITDNLSIPAGISELQRFYGAYSAYANRALKDDADRFRRRWRRQNHFFLDGFVFSDLFQSAAGYGIASDSGLASPRYGARDCVPAGTSRVWAGGFGSWARQDSRSGLSGYDYDSYGLALGYEYTRDRLRLGVAAAYSRGDLEVDDLGYENKPDVANFALYGAYVHDSGVYLEGGLGYGHAWNDYHTNMLRGGRKTGKYGSDVFSADLELGYVARLACGYNLIPSLGLEYDYLRNGSWTEKVANSAAPANRFASGRDHALDIPVGLRANKVFTLGNGNIIVPEIRASYIYTANKSRPTIRSGFTGAPGAATMHGVDPGRSHWRFGAGLSGQINRRVDFHFEYEFDTRSGYRGHNLNASVGLSF